MARPNPLAATGKSKSTVNIVDPTSFPSNLAEAGTFFAGSVPPEVKRSIELFHSNPAENVALLIEVAARYLAEDAHHFSLDAALYEKFPSPEVTNTLLTSIYIILRTSLRNKAKVSIIKRDLLAMHIPAPVVAKFCEQMVKSRTALEQVMVIEKRIHFPRLEKVRWRIDVAISSGSLSRVMRPNLLMQLVTRDGSVSTFEVSLEQFNQLRYNVAKVLNEMNTMERHPIIRIVNEFRRREEEDYNN